MASRYSRFIVDIQQKTKVQKLIYPWITYYLWYFTRCANATVCEEEWLQKTSAKHYCYGIDLGPLYFPNTCSFCCSGDLCNSGSLVPDSHTLYSKYTKDLSTSNTCSFCCSGDLCNGWIRPSGRYRRLSLIWGMIWKVPYCHLYLLTDIFSPDPQTQAPPTVPTTSTSLPTTVTTTEPTTTTEHHREWQTNLIN